jgi:hypothetical protein
MWISANRAHLAWTPLLGWILLSCAAPAAQAQPAPAAAGAGTSPAAATTDAGATPAGPVPPGGAAPAPPSTVYPEEPVRRDSTATESTTPATRAPVRTGVSGPLGPNPSTLTGVSSSVSSSVNTSVAPSVQSPIGGGGSLRDELGVTVGGFRLFPQLSVNVGADSNVFAQNASQGAVGSLYTAIIPSLELRSQWLNHELKALLNAGLGFYASAPSQNYQNYTAQLDGKLEILQDFYVPVSVAYKRITEPLGTPNTTAVSAPTVVDVVPVKIGLYQRFNRVFYEVTALATRYRHHDFSNLAAGGIPASSRDRTEYEERFRLGYEITDDFSIFVQPSINQRRYVIPFLSTADSQRDSNGFNLGFGFTQKFTATSSIEGIIGYQTQNYVIGGPTSDYTFGLSGNWSGISRLTLRPNFARTINESALSNFKNIVNTVVGVDFTYDIHDAWTAIGGLSYNLADYTPVDSSVTQARTDKIFRGQLGLLYSLRPEVQIGPVYEFTQGSSSDSTNGPDYNRHVFYVRMIGKR